MIGSWKPSLKVFGPAALSVTLLAVTLSDCQREHSSQPLNLPTLSTLQNGDLIFRDGRGWRSDAVRAGSQTSWTHIGIIVVEKPDEIWVVHASPDTSDKGFVEKQPLAEFLTPKDTNDFGVYRLANVTPDIRASIAETVLAHASKKTAFDHQFDIEDRSKLYCTELIIDAFEVAAQRLDFQSKRLNLGLSEYSIVFPESLIQSNNLKRIH